MKMGHDLDMREYNLKLVSLSWPIFVESFLRLLLGNVNIFMLGQFSDDAVGAVGVANQIISLVLVMYGIVSMGTVVIMSQLIGAGNREKAAEVANIALAINVAFGIAMSLMLSLLAVPILRLMNIPPELMEYARQYLVIAGAFTFTQAFMAVLSGISRSFGYTKLPMYVAFAMNILNMLGSYVSLYRPFGMPVLGVPGVAAAMVGSEAVAGIFLFIMVYRKIGLKFRFGDFMPIPRDTVKMLLKVGVPSAGESMAYNFAQMATTYIVTMFGANAITARVYGQSISVFSTTLGGSFGLGSQILVGQLVGAGKYNKAYKVCISALKMGIASNFVFSVLIFAFRRQITGIFTHNTAIIGMVSVILAIDILVETGRAANLAIGNSLRGAGDVRFPMIISILSMWGVSVTLCYVFGVVLKMGLAGIWFAFAADECLRGVLMLRRWRSRTWVGMSVIEGTKTV